MPEMEIDERRGDGLRSYYITKIEELQLVVSEKTQNLRRLQAQRNELNAKGNYSSPLISHKSTLTFNLTNCLTCHLIFLSANVTRRTPIIARTRILCR